MSESREATDGIATAGAAVCALCGAVRDMDTMMIELVDGGMVWVCTYPVHEAAAAAS